MNLIILLPEDKVEDNLYILSDYRAEHLLKIIKVTINTTIQTGLLNGAKGKSEIIKIEDNKLFLNFTSVETISLKRKIEVDIICALPRPQTLKKILALSGTFEIRSLTLINSNRVEKSYYQSPLLEETKLNHFLIEGLMQGKFTRLPKVKIFDKFKKFWDEEFNDDLFPNLNQYIKLIAHPETNSTVYSKFKITNKNYLVVLGPEGGWIPFEIEYIKSKKFTPINLGLPVLRVESALNAILSQIELCKLIYSAL